MRSSLGEFLAGRELTSEAKDYLLREYYRHAGVTVIPAVITCFVLILFEWKQLDSLYAWIWPILMLLIQALRLLLSKNALEHHPKYKLLFFAIDYLSAFWWIAYLYFYGWHTSTEHEYLFRAFVVFNIYAFYVAVMRFNLVALIINASIVCFGILVFLVQFTNFPETLMWSYVLLDMFGLATIWFFGRISHLMACETHDLISRNQKLIARMDDMLITDELTQQPNRRYFNAQLARYVELFKTNREVFVLAVVDIDFFKKINDSYGHDVGDSALIEIGHFFRKRIRNTDIFARYGGEEFVILLPLASAEVAFNVLDKLRAQCANHQFQINESILNLTVSIGIAEFSDGDNEDSIFKRADSALYKAKKNGRNRIEFTK